MRIAAWGDSITYGACDPEALGWIGRIRKEKFVQTEEKCTVYNRGIGGDTSRGLLARFSVELESLHPEVVIIAIGVNDTVYRDNDMTLTDVPLAEFESNMREIIALSKGQTPQTYVIGISAVVDELLQPFPWSATGKCYANAVIETFNESLKSIAEEAGVTFIPTFTLLSPEDLTDGIHPTAAGYDKLATVIGNAIR